VRVSQNRLLLGAAGLAVAVILITALALVSAWVFHSDTESVTGHVVSIDPAGSLVRVCVMDAATSRTLCGEISPSLLTASGAAQTVGQCAYVKVARGAAVAIDKRECVDGARSSS
jgi:hypothetical protein